MSRPDEDSTGAAPRFATYSPSAGSISADAAALTSTAGSPESVADTVAGRHNAAVAGVSGMVQNAMAGQDQAAKDMAIAVSRRAISGGSSLGRFAGYVREHDARVAQWNGQIAAEPDLQAQRDCYNRLVPAHTDSLEELRTGAKASEVARYLRQPLDVETIRALFTAGAMPASTPAIFSNVPLTGEEQLQAVLAKVASGEIPPLAELTEEERRALLAANPDLLPWLMGKAEPSPDEMNLVRDLAIPHVDGADGDAAGQDVLDALDETATPEEFARALGMVGQFGAYAAWAQRHGGPVIPTGQMDFLRRFYGKTGDRLDDIQDYIADDQHRVENGSTTTYGYPFSDPNGTTVPDFDLHPGFPEGQQQAGLRDLANGLLTLSDHRLGGGWDQVPEEVRQAVQDRPEYTYAAGNTVGVDWNDDFDRISALLADGDVAPGDGLAKELAQTASTTLAYTDGVFGRDEDGGARDALEVLGRNHHATSEVLSGEDMPEGFSHTRFLENVYGHDWSDDGAAASTLTDWIDEGLRDSDPAAQADADRAWNGVVDGVTSPGAQGAFGALMGGDETAMQRNPEIAHSLLEMTVPRLDTFAENHPDSAQISDRDQMRLMMLLASEPDTADALAGAVHLEQQRLVDGIANTDFSDANETGDMIGRLQAKFDAGVFNAGRAAEMSDAEAEAQRLAVIKTGISLAGSVNPGAGVAANLLNNSLSAPNSNFDDVDVPGDWERDDQTDLMRARINNEILQARGGDVGDVATDPMSLAGDIDDIRNGLVDSDIDRANWTAFDSAMGARYENTYGSMGPDVSIDDIFER